MKGPRNPADIIIAALIEHNVSVKREEIESAFNDDGSNARWALEHLSRDTLLSKEELTLYSKLEGSGALKKILHSPDIDATRPLLEQDIRTAIEFLKASTTAIQSQIEILALQSENLNKQIRLENGRRQLRSRDMAQLRRKHELKRQNIAAASNDLVHEFKTDLKNETEKTTAEGKRVLSLMTARLKDDDRTFGALERLASGVDSTGENAAAVRQTVELSATLAEYVTEEIHHRLDRLFLENIHDSQLDSDKPTETSDNQQEEIIAALEEELESLYPEIGVLAEMSTKQQFSEPILRQLQNHHGQLRVASHRKLEYIVDKVADMTSSTENLTERLRDRKSFRETLEALTAVYQLELGDDSPKEPARRETLRRRSVQALMLGATARTPAAPLQESLAFENLLRRLGIPSESAFQSQKENGGARMLYEKEAYMLECLRNLGIAADSPLAAQLIPMDLASRLLSSCLNADSPFEATLSNADQEKRLAALEAQLGLVQKGIEGLNLDILYQRDKAQDRFLERWL